MTVQIETGIGTNWLLAPKKKALSYCIYLPRPDPTRSGLFYVYHLSTRLTDH